MDPRICFLALMLMAAGSSASAQTYDREKPRRHFVTFSYHWIHVEPLHFADHPLGDLTGREVASAQREAYEYRTRDGEILIDVVEFSRRLRGAGISLYPLGMRTGPALTLRGSIEGMPQIHVAFTGPAPVAVYGLTGGRAIDAGVGVTVADRSPGWGLGSHAYVIAGVGRITSDLGDGRRTFAEGGGGLTAGPFGVELGVKFAWNRLSEPVAHRFLTIPVTLRGTLTF